LKLYERKNESSSRGGAAQIKTWIDPKVREEGKKEGIKEGKNQKAMEIALDFFSLGASTDMIVKATGLTEEDVARLHK
jgi:predicted transposase/invertase (TIGR01784 family)